ncbi:MAG TPA: hypothetical protein VNM36_06995 [Gemmatimonadaceae bacterium]|jgi:uncharacterized membrane protein|nr:hypothetical protein [Gemmatimonadaceae bacterium]
MRQAWNFVVRSVVSGLLVIVPVYLAALLVGRVLQSLAGLVQPLAGLLPDWLPAENLLALLLGLLICFLIGASLRTPTGRAARERMETSVFEKIPGYSLFRGLTRQIAGVSYENVWKPALSEIEDALVPSFIIEDLPDGSYTVFVPSVPTPLAGAVYILPRERVHPLDIPFADAIKTVVRWGAGSGKLVAAMKR